MSVISALLLLILLFTVELAYFKIAGYYKIIDAPNERSSHKRITIRGGGIIFCIAVLTWWLLTDFKYPFFVCGLLAIALISFLDDIHTLNRKVRLGIHVFSVMLLFYQWNLFGMYWYILLAAAIFVIATINAYNFMDGINGITGIYSLITLITLFYINRNLKQFGDENLLLFVIISVLVFGYFNFRKRAKCFAGDVGSVSMAFILTFFIGQLILITHNYHYIFLLLIYGLDTSFTVCFRAIRKENILEAHRSHFYQYLANDKKWGHLTVSLIYSGVQLLFNLLLIYLINKDSAYITVVILCATIIFFCIRLLSEGREKLFSRSSA